MDKRHLKILVFTLIFSIFISLPASAADGKKNNPILVEYNEIEKIVTKNNLQIKVDGYSIDDMKDALDASSDSSGDMRDLQNAIYNVSDGLNAYAGSPDLGPLAQAIQFSLELSASSFSVPMGSNNDDAKDQIRAAELGYEQSHTALVNSAEKMFVLYHQIENNINLMEVNRELMVSQLDLAKHRLELGLIPPATITDLQKSLLDFDNNTASLRNQRDALILQFKNLIGLTIEDEIEFGKLPETDKDYVLKIDFNDDLEKALKNSLSIKSKKAELKSADKKTRDYQIEIKENDVTQKLNSQYQLLLEKYNTLKLSEIKLASLNAKLFTEDVRYQMGQTSLIDFRSFKNEIESQKSTVKTDSSNLFIEIENYKAMLDGMI